MAIEATIDKLTAAVLEMAAATNENTAALLAGGTATPEPAKKAAPKKEAKPKAKPDPEPEEKAAPEEPEFDRDAVVTEITEYVKERINSAGKEAPDRSAEVKDQFSAYRKKYGVNFASEVKDDLLQEFLDGAKELLG